LWRYLAGAFGALCLIGAASLWNQGRAGPVVPDTGHQSPDFSLAGAAPARSPEASPQSREQRRFKRYDRDRNGQVSRGEYLLGREKAFAKLDLNHDGRLSLDEYAAKAVTKFTLADADRSGNLAPKEFATTAVKRNDAPTRADNCQPGRGALADDGA
jgi:hypothetical protein